MSYRTGFKRKSGYERDEELARQAAEREQYPQAQSTEETVEVDPELRKYEARRKITRMVIIRVIMCAMLLWTIIRFEMPTAMRVLLVVVILMILGTMMPVLSTLKTTLKYEDE